MTHKNIGLLITSARLDFVHVFPSLCFHTISCDFWFFLSPKTILISKMYITVKAEKSTSGHFILYILFILFGPKHNNVGSPLLLLCVDKHFNRRALNLLYQHQHLWCCSYIFSWKNFNYSNKFISILIIFQGRCW